MKSIKNRIEKKLGRKTNIELVKTIILTKKNKEWEKVSHLISASKRKAVSMNLSEINSLSNENDSVIVPGKVLGSGSINKKIKIVALSFSKSAEEKLKKLKIEYTTISEEIKKNQKANKLKIIVK
ncbi:MAG: 50S ribosomal protein L18e [Candidatus Pacearchaeota archaeon]